MNDTAIAEKPVLVEPPFTRRFERPDIDKHAAWFIPRLLKTFPHLTERYVYTWLLNIMQSNEFMFLYQEHAVALAQVVAYSMRPEAIVEEIFVWCEDPKDKAQVEDAAYFYDHFYQWAKRKGLTTLTVAECSDVPPDLIRKQLGNDEQSKRLFERKVHFARVT
jgi:hypothetical protein